MSKAHGVTPQVSQRLACLVPGALNTPLSQVPAEGGRLGSKASGRRPPGGEGRVPCPSPGSPTQPAPAGMWSSRSLAAPGATTSKGGDRGSPLPGLPRLPGDDNFPATGSSWPGSLAALPPRLPAMATPSRRAGGCTDSERWGVLRRAPGGPARGEVCARGNSPEWLGSPPRRAPASPGPERVPHRRPPPPRAPSGWG